MGDLDGATGDGRLRIWTTLDAQASLWLACSLGMLALLIAVTTIVAVRGNFSQRARGWLWELRLTVHKSSSSPKKNRPCGFGRFLCRTSTGHLSDAQFRAESEDRRQKGLLSSGLKLRRMDDYACIFCVIQDILYVQQEAVDRYLCRGYQLRNRTCH